MKRFLTPEDLHTDWMLLPAERDLLANKSRKTHVGFSVLLKYFQIEGRFPASAREIPLVVADFVARQLDATVDSWLMYSWDGVTIKRHRMEIREWCGYREATRRDLCDLKNWLIADALPQDDRVERLREALLERCRHLKIEPPTSDQISRLILSALAKHEKRFCIAITGNLNEAMQEQLHALLQTQTSDDGEWTTWQTLKSDPGKAGINSIKDAVVRLLIVRRIGLPTGLFKGVPPKLLERYAKRAAVEEPFELRRHTTPLRSTLMAAFLLRRSEELTDHLVDLLVETVHKMGKKAEKRIDEGIGAALQKAPSKMTKLDRIAKASVQAP